jgi:hydrogenase/urease accessory protein HupE
VLLIITSCFVGLARAHDVGLSIATVRLQTNGLQTVIAFAIRETEQIISLDADHDGHVSTNEFLAGREKLAVAVAEKCEVRFDDVIVRPDNFRCQLEEGDRVDVILHYPATHFRELQMKFPVIKQLATGHRMFFSLINPAGESVADRLLDAKNDSVLVEIGTASEPAPTESAPRTFFDFLMLGVEHIGTGYDHLLFLFGLLIVTRTFKSALAVITAFTLAHSITLAVATFNVFTLPAKYTEPLIAASIVYVGVENLLRHGDPKGRWMLTFAFGLIHGFGFASVLRDLGVGSNGSGVAMPLFSFNLGVELGQIAVAAIVLPLIWKLRTKPIFVQRWVPACSIAVALAGSYWFIQRVWF